VKSVWTVDRCLSDAADAGVMMVTATLIGAAAVLSLDRAAVARHGHAVTALMMMCVWPAPTTRTYQRVDQPPSETLSF